MNLMLLVVMSMVAIFALQVFYRRNLQDNIDEPDVDDKWIEQRW